MKLISLNIGIKIDNTKEVLEFLNEEKSDIIALQESMRPFDNNVYKQYRIGADIKNNLNDTHKYEFFAPLFITKEITKNGNTYLDFGGDVEQGTQILSKLPIQRASNNFYYNNYSYGFDATKFKEHDWCRSFQVTVLNYSDNKRLKVINIHGIWNGTRLGDNRTINQSKSLIDEVKKDNIPVIIVGDFNLLPESESIKMIDVHLKNLSTKYNIKTTRGSDRESSVVDYIFVSDKIKVNDFKVLDTNISDHLPLILDFDIL